MEVKKIREKSKVDPFIVVIALTTLVAGATWIYFLQSL
jgi:hypothetical protein